MKLLVILTTCAVCLDLIKAKSNTSNNQEAKAKGSSKLNSISTTAKPDTPFLHLEQQQYRQQNYPQQPPPPQYQTQTQPQRQLQGHDQALILQPIQAAQQPQAPQQQLQQHAAYQAQLQQAAYQAQLQPQPQQAAYQAQLQPQLQQAAYQAQLQPQLQQAAYQAQLQPQLQQVIQKAYFIPQQHNRPAHMILIAQPAYVPPNVVYGGGAQQLLNYYQSNPQARYQFLHGNTQGPPQQLVQQTPAHSIGNYQVVAVPAQYQPNVIAVPGPIPQPSHLAQPVPVDVRGQLSQPEASHQPSPLQLAQIAQLATQQYSRINPSQAQQQVASSSPITYQSQHRALQDDAQATSPVKSIPPIITGFEHFTPEQQEKIKAQLSTYFGGPLQQLPSSRIPVNSVQEGEGQGKARSQYTQRYQEDQSRSNNNGFIPSEQIKGDASASSSNVFKSHYARV